MIIYDIVLTDELIEEQTLRSCKDILAKDVYRETWDENYVPIYIGEEDLEESEVPEDGEPWWGGDDGT